MPIFLPCSCGRKLTVKDELAGKKVRCPACQGTMTVPVGGAAVSEKPMAMARPAMDDLDDEPVPRRRRREDDDEDEGIADKPLPKRRRDADDEDDEPATRRRRRNDDEDDDRPRRGRADDDDDRSRRRSRRDIEDSEDEARLSRRKPRRRIDDDDDGPSIRKRGANAGFGSTGAGVLGGLLMMVVAVVWFVVGLHGNYIFYYPPVLFIVGLVAMIKGFAGRS